MQVVSHESQADSLSRTRSRAHGKALRHSARVRLMRRLIPVAAGVGIIGIVGAVVYSKISTVIPEVSVASIGVQGSKVTMEHPRLSGFRKGARGYDVIAAAAVQDVRKPALVELETLKGQMATDDKGGLVHMEAKYGVFNSTEEWMALHHDIKIWTDKGEEARLKSAFVNFKSGSVSSDDHVTVSVPNGSVTANKLELVDNGARISFIGSVHAEIQPKDSSPGKAEVAEAAPIRGSGEADASR